jgi:3-isopropylmalate dehydrogenase
MKAKITVLPGDGIGPEVTREGVRALQRVADVFGHDFQLTTCDFGGIAIDNHGDPLPPATLQSCLESDAILLGAIGGPKWSATDAKLRPEAGLLRIRRELGVYANLRPVAVHPALADSTTLKADVVRGVDLIFVRELTGGIYFGAKTRDANSASDLCSYSVPEVERVTRVAARLAGARRRKLTSIDKSNVLETSRLWRDVVTRLMKSEYPDIEVQHILVDAAAMHLIRRPSDFDVIVTENMFGDILTDEASMLAGSLGLSPSASLGDGRRGLYEPIHGSAPDIAGKGIANPIGTILSAAMLLRHSLNLEVEARAVERAVSVSLQDGLRTADIAAGGNAVSTEAAGVAIAQQIRGA